MKHLQRVADRRCVVPLSCPRCGQDSRAEAMVELEWGLVKLGYFETRASKVRSVLAAVNRAYSRYQTAKPLVGSSKPSTIRCWRSSHSL